MTWFVRYRLEWVRTMIEVYGFINREHLQRMFGISTPQASYDIQKVMEKWPDLMEYNKTAKRYERRAK